MKRLRVRPTVAAFTGAVCAALLLRSFAVGVGPDEFSLLTMAAAIRNGDLPYAAYWDVRPPLAYLWALPSAYAEDAVTAVGLLRLLAWAALAGAAWIFFCLFQRSLGVAPAALGRWRCCRDEHDRAARRRPAEPFQHGPVRDGVRLLSGGAAWMAGARQSVRRRPGATAWRQPPDGLLRLRIAGRRIALDDGAGRLTALSLTALAMLGESRQGAFRQTSVNPKAWLWQRRCAGSWSLPFHRLR